MAKERNRHGEDQQIIYLNGKLQTAIRDYEAEKTGKPFEYRHYGFLFAGTRLHYQNMGFSLEWNHNRDNKTKSYWSFTTHGNIKQ